MTDGLKIRIQFLDETLQVLSPIADMQTVSYIIVEAIPSIVKHNFTMHSAGKDDPYVEIELNPNFESNQPNSCIFREISTNQDADHALDMLCNFLKLFIANKITYISFKH